MTRGGRLVLLLAATAEAVGLAVACGSRSNGLPATETATDGGAAAEGGADGGLGDARLASDPCAFPSSGGAPPATVDAFVAALRSAQCARMVRCGLIDPSDLAACPAAIDYTTGGDGNTLASLLHDEAAGGTVIVGPGAQRCLDSFAAAGCDPSSQACLGTAIFGIYGSGIPSDTFAAMAAFGGPACKDALAGQLAIGAPCTTDYQCTQQCLSTGCSGPPLDAGDACETANDPRCPTSCVVVEGDGSYPFVCSPFAGDGQPCGLTRACDPQHVCPRAPTGNGAVCGEALRGLPGAPCSDDRMCVPGLYCDPASSHCTTRLPEGSPCAATFACADGLWCRGFDPTGVAGTCEAPHAMPCVAPSAPLGRDGCLGLVETCSDAGACSRLGDDGSPCAGPGSGYCAYIPATWCPLGSNLPASANPYDCRSVGEAGAPCLLYNDCLDHVCNAGRCG